MGWSTADIPDLSGRVAIVMGANGGLGLETARELARKGAHVVMASRDEAKADRARAEILADVPDAWLEHERLDLASLDSVRAAAARILAAHPTIDILIDNAGIMGIPEKQTDDGFEMQLATNCSVARGAARRPARSGRSRSARPGSGSTSGPRSRRPARPTTQDRRARRNGVERSVRRREPLT